MPSLPSFETLLYIENEALADAEVEARKIRDDKNLKQEIIKTQNILTTIRLHQLHTREIAYMSLWVLIGIFVVNVVALFV